MSLSRQVLSSPFDIPSRPRKISSSKHNGGRDAVSKGSLGKLVNNIMVDSRVVRRSIFSSSLKNAGVLDPHCSGASGEGTEQSHYILFDSRLIKGDVFASPIVTVIEEKSREKCRKKQNRIPVSECENYFL